MADAVRLVRVGQLPQIAALPDVTIDDADTLSVPISVTYPLGAVEDLELSLGATSAPGVVLSAATVVSGQATVTATLSWPATVARETGSFLMEVIATDSSHPTRRDQRSFWVTVGEPNQAPRLNPVPARTIARGTIVATQFFAGDADGPDWDLRFSLGSDRPAGASIDPVSGWLSWDTSTASLGTHVVSVMVTDEGNPPRSDQFDWSLEILDAGVPAHLLAPDSQSLAEDSSLVFSASLGNQLEVNSSANVELTLALVSADGTMVVPPATGITYELGEAQPASHIKLRGTATALNQALDGLTLTPSADFRGTAVLRRVVGPWQYVASSTLGSVGDPHCRGRRHRRTDGT